MRGRYFLRITDADRATAERNRRKESEAFDICEKKIADHGLEMKLVNVSCSSIIDLVAGESAKSYLAPYVNGGVKRSHVAA